MGRKCRGIRWRDRNLTFFRNFLLLQQFVFWTITTLNSCYFQRFWKKIIFSYFSKAVFCLLFPLTKVCLQLGNFPSCCNKLQDIYSVNSIFRGLFLPLQQLASLNSSEISIFKFLWQFLFTIFFSYKVSPFISPHKNKINSAKY